MTDVKRPILSSSDRGYRPFGKGAVGECVDEVRTGVMIVRCFVDEGRVLFFLLQIV